MAFQPLMVPFWPERTSEVSQGEFVSSSQAPRVEGASGEASVGLVGHKIAQVMGRLMEGCV